ncbi:hypothetical protein [Streptomyces sp. URMC 123]|uniref:hypothetical protein n=1 Tax=Streptomyces sp. URMC 123 TaxID=3423403 RepID=UPI003F1B9228
MAAVPMDLLDRIRALERQVRALMGSANTRPAMNEIMSGNVTIGEGGQLIVFPPGGERPTFAVGQWPDGSYGAQMRRQDGSAALVVEGDGSEKGMIRMMSRDTAAASRVLIMDDFYSDTFLGRPWMPIPMFPTERQNTSQTAYEPAWVGECPVHNAVTVIKLVTYSPHGGQVKVTMTTGGTTVTLAEYDVPAAQWTWRTIVRPNHGMEFLQSAVWNVNHRCKAQNSDIETRLFSAYTRNTQNAGEKPEPPVRPAAKVSPTAAVPSSATSAAAASSASGPAPAAEPAPAPGQAPADT